MEMREVPVLPMQTQTVSRSDLVIRPAREEDRAALESITDEVWHGSGYTPDLLASWIEDPYDGLFVATLAGEVIGAIKLTRLSPGEWWLEGLRLAGDYRQQGLARILHHFAINQLRQRGGAGVVRFSAASGNAATHRLARETGFDRVAEFVPLAADALNEPVAGLQPLALADAERVGRWLAASAYFAQAQRSLESDLTFYQLDDVRLAERLADGLVYGRLTSDGTLTGVVILNLAHDDSPDAAGWVGDPVLSVAYCDVALADVESLGCDLRRLAASLDRLRVRLKVLNQPKRLAALAAAGFTREWDGTAWLYARDVKLTEHADVRTEQVPPIDGSFNSSAN
jgi:ribosomal protein S18 acetylase RimI-like enzyme